MSDHPKNAAKKGRTLERVDREFDRICREEAADGETVVVARAICSAPFPCLVNIHVLAGFNAACPNCEWQVQPMRDMHGWKNAGEFWSCDRLTKEQIDKISERAKKDGLPF